MWPDWRCLTQTATAFSGPLQRFPGTSNLLQWGWKITTSHDHVLTPARRYQVMQTGDAPIGPWSGCALVETGCWRATVPGPKQAARVDPSLEHPGSDAGFQQEGGQRG